MTHKTSIIGLGVMGQRMLTNMTDHDQFKVVVAWDPDAEVFTGNDQANALLDTPIREPRYDA